MQYDKAFSMDRKVALVTGGANGLGAEISIALAQAGAQVLVTDIADAGGRRTVEAIRKGGGTAECLVQDVASEDQWEQTIEYVVRVFGGLDVVVNNAGVEIAGLISTCTLDTFRRVQTVNVEGVFLGCKHGVCAMSPGGAAGRGGSIVNISSGAGIFGAVALGAYGASKGAVRALSKHAAVECARLRTGIRVNSIHPGLVETDMGFKVLDDMVSLGLASSRDSAQAALLSMHPMGQLGQPRDVACGVLYLASDASRWVTGSELIIDGGFAAA